MKNQKGLALSQSKGFTLIELIIVIAIIAVLASIVLISATQYINKSKDATSKGEIQSLILSANFAANNHSSGKYDLFTCTTERTWLNILAKDPTAVCGTDIATSTNFCACFTEISKSTPTYYCQDSTGIITEQTAVNCSYECNLSNNALCGHD